MTNINLGVPDFDPTGVIHVIEEGIQIEKLILEANKIIKNDTEALILELRITEAKILLHRLRFGG